MNKIKPITKAQLLRELEPYTDEAPIRISVGREKFDIHTVISGANAVWLESDIPTPRKVGKKGGRPITNNSPEAVKQREYQKRYMENLKGE